MSNRRAFPEVNQRRLDKAVFEPIIDQQRLVGYDCDEIMEAITCPTLLLPPDWSAGGMLVDDDAERFESADADCSRVRFPDVGHVIHWARTQELLGYVQLRLSSPMSPR